MAWVTGTASGEMVISSLKHLLPQDDLQFLADCLFSSSESPAVGKRSLRIGGGLEQQRNLHFP